MEHEAGNYDCGACRRGYPIECDCGGLIHASKGCVVTSECDKCDEPAAAMEKPYEHPNESFQHYE